MLNRSLFQGACLLAFFDASFVERIGVALGGGSGDGRRSEAEKQQQQQPRPPPREPHPLPQSRWLPSGRGGDPSARGKRGREEGGDFSLSPGRRGGEGRGGGGVRARV